MVVAQKKEIRLDLGCGPNKRDGHIGIDSIRFPGVDHVLDLGSKRLPYKDGTVTSIWTSHFVEHLTATERCHLFNEAHRVLIPKGQMVMVVPFWGSSRAYGDPTHQWPPIGEMWFYYLNREWRKSNAPHTDKKHWAQGYDCDFDATWGVAMHPEFAGRSPETQQFAATFYKEAVQDIQATLTKR